MRRRGRSRTCGKEGSLEKIDTAITAANATLRLMQSYEPWIDEDHDRLYADVLKRWTPELIERVVQHAADTCSKRPSRADLIKMAAELESPLPSTDEAF